LFLLILLDLTTSGDFDVSAPSFQKTTPIQGIDPLSLAR
jgi:hypothetical protein